MAAPAAPVAKLGEETLPAIGDITWVYQPGVHPHVAEIAVFPGQADRLIAASGPLDLQIGSQVVRGLWVLDKLPGDNPHECYVRVADSRFWWIYKHVLRRFNMRRRVGFFRVTEPNREELQAVSDLVQYARYSLRNDRPWTPQEVLTEVLSYVIKESWPGPAGGEPKLVFHESFGTVSAGHIESLELDDSGEAAIARAMAYLPEVELFVNNDGDVVVYNRASGAELDLPEKLGPEMEGGGVALGVQHYNEMPQFVDVLVPFEVEIRFDYVEGGASRPADPFEESRELKNVIAVPDFVVEIGGESYPQGSWVPFAEYLRALPPGPSAGPAGAGLPGLAINDEIIRMSMIPYSPLWASLGLKGEEDADADWAARIAAVQRHYRTTFRIPRGWMDRVASIKAYRVATTNQSTGERAPAEAYSDYCVVNADRAWRATWQGSDKLVWANNVQGYPRGNTAPGAQVGTPFQPDSRPAPARVAIADHDQGILHLQYQLDPVRLADQILPGFITPDLIPSAMQTRYGVTRPITFDSVITSNPDRPVQLSPHYGAAIVVTLMPAAPNDNRQLYRIRVRPDDVVDLLPPAMIDHIRQARGPVKEVRLRKEAARVAWIDNRAEELEALFGLGPRGVVEFDPEDGNPVDSLVVNANIRNRQLAPPTAGPGASLNESARAIAARLWATYAPHLVGHRSGKYDMGITPVGWVDSVIHTLNPTGTLTSSVVFPDRLPEFDWLTIVDSGTRALLLREVYRGE